MLYVTLMYQCIIYGSFFNPVSSFYRLSIVYLSSIYRLSIVYLSSIYRLSIVYLSFIYRLSSGFLSTFFRLSFVTGFGFVVEL